MTHTQREKRMLVAYTMGKTLKQIARQWDVSIGVVGKAIDRQLLDYMESRAPHWGKQVTLNAIDRLRTKARIAELDREKAQRHAVELNAEIRELNRRIAHIQGQEYRDLYHQQYQRNAELLREVAELRDRNERLRMELMEDCA